MNQMATWTWRRATLAAFMACAVGCADADRAAGGVTDTESANLNTASNALRGRNAYDVHRLVSDQPGVASVMDSLLKNPWGLARGTSGPWWVADNGAVNGTSHATLYNGAGVKQSLVVNVPGAPTGQVFNFGTGFVVTNGVASGVGLFIFASEDGTISAWNPNVTLTTVPSTQAFVTFPPLGAPPPTAIYKGLAIAATSMGDRLYATDFHNNKVDVFDPGWNRINVSDTFVDPNLPAGYAPFGIRALAGKLLVTYALQDADAEDDVAGPGNGFVDAYSFEGQFLGRVATGAQLNAPWGLALAPSNFGKFSGLLLVGNFGDGRIHAFDLGPDLDPDNCQPRGCTPAGALHNDHGGPIKIDGLWAIDFGGGTPNNVNGATNDLFFTSGPNEEANGLFGFIEPVG